MVTELLTAPEECVFRIVASMLWVNLLRSLAGAGRGEAMLSGTELNRTVFVAGFAVFFTVLALNLTVPMIMVSVMGLVDRFLMRIWYGPPLFKAQERTA